MLPADHRSLLWDKKSAGAKRDRSSLFFERFTVSSLCIFCDFFVHVSSLVLAALDAVKTAVNIVLIGKDGGLLEDLPL